jgi:hypothetical protein
MVLLIIWGVLTYLITGFIIADWMSCKSEEPLHWSWFLVVLLLWQVAMALVSIVTVGVLLYGFVMWVYKKFKKKTEPSLIEGSDNTTV